MAAAFRSSNSTTYGSRTNTTLTAPAGIADGDVLLIVFLIGAASPPAPTAPSGFAAVSGGTFPTSVTDAGFNVKMYCWYKIASGESGNYTITHTSASTQGYIAAVSGGSSSQPAATTNTGINTTSTALTITPAANDALILFAEHDWGDISSALSPPAGTTPTFTERLDPGTVSGIMYAADGVLATAGATGNKSITNNNSGGAGHPWAAIMVVVEAGGGGGGASLVHRNLLLGVGT